MRLKPEIKSFIKSTAFKLFPEAEIYLFGSRVNDNGLGGDIDILLLTEKKIDTKKLRAFRINFYKHFGWQKIDLVNFTKNENSTFKELILTEAQPI
jgi:predicted nucleotidyltransferase